MRNPALIACLLLCGCKAGSANHLQDGAVSVPERAVHFPQRAASGGEWLGGGEAQIAGRLVVANGCLALAAGDQVRPIVWHREARLGADGRHVIDTRSGKSVTVGEVLSVAGGLYARPDESSARRLYPGLPRECAGDDIIVVGSGFHE